MTTYQVTADSKIYRSVSAAVQAAKKLAVNDDPSMGLCTQVTMHEHSGTHRSATVIWPKVGQTRTS